MAEIGILDLKEYGFAQDVLKKLPHGTTEFASFGHLDYEKAKAYDVIVDRLSFQDPYLRQALMLASMEGTYVLNNPFSSSINNKVLEHRIARSLGIRQPETFVLPRMNEKWELGGSVREPDWEELRKKMTLPCIMKPFDGFAWENVYTIASYRELENVYNALKDSHIMLLQEKIEYTDYFRVFCINKKEVLITRWDPVPFGAGKYSVPDEKQMEVFGKRIREATIRMNEVLDFDFNAVEWCVDENGDLCMIEAMNEVPDIERGCFHDGQYWWIVEKISECIMEKLHSKERNRTAFDTG